MYVIDPENLEAGDVILLRSSTRESELIRRANKSNFSHALLYVGVMSCIESDGLGVRSQNLQRLIVEDQSSAKVFRLRNPEGHIIHKAVEYARRMVGMEYDTSEAKRAANYQESSAINPNRQFCTRFIAKSYEYAGVSISYNPDYCSPKDIENSESLREVEDCLKDATPEDISYIKDNKSPLDIQLDIQNEILGTSRNIAVVSCIDGKSRSAQTSPQHRQHRPAILPSLQPPSALARCLPAPS